MQCNSISKDVYALHRALQLTKDSKSSLFRVCDAVAHIVSLIFKALGYLGKTLIDRNWDHIFEAKNCLSFVLVILRNTFSCVQIENSEPCFNIISPQDNVPPLLPVNGEKHAVEISSCASIPIEDSSKDVFASEEKTIEDLSYNAIPISEKELAALQVIAIQIGTATFWSPPNVFKTKNAGADVDQLHPLRFIGFFCNDHLLDRGKTPRELLRAIRYGGNGTDTTRVGFYWGPFVEPLANSFQNRLEKGEIYPYLKSFAETVGADPEKIKSFFEPLDCTGLVDYLLHRL